MIPALFVVLAACSPAETPSIAPIPEAEPIEAAPVHSEGPGFSEEEDAALVAAHPPRLGVPAGTRVVIEATIIMGGRKGHEGGPNVLVARIDGRPTQAWLAMPVRREESVSEAPSPVFGEGSTWRIEGYERVEATGGNPWRTRKVQSTGGRYAASRFVAVSYAPTVATPFDPAEYVGQDALVSGRAMGKGRSAWIAPDVGSWRIACDGPWPAALLGKEVEVRGVVRATAEAGTFAVAGTPRLVQLADQLGRTVALRGVVWNLNRFQWLDYRGERLYVDGEMPGHGDPLLVRGTLAREDRPEITTTFEAPDRLYYVVKDATWEETGELLAPEVGEL